LIWLYGSAPTKIFQGSVPATMSSHIVDVINVHLLVKVTAMAAGLLFLSHV
jgi:hypothetical protein